jgi:cupin fold WbuC family metalloprotein
MNNILKKFLGPGVWVNDEIFPRFSISDVQFCIGEVNNSPTRRARICMHPETSDRMQEMFIAFDGATYVRPSYHRNKDESFHMIEGFGKYVFFDNEGNQVGDVRLGPYESDLPFYCRIPGNLSHSLIVFSQYAVAHEVGTGPFEKSETYFPYWSPDYQTDMEKDAYRTKYSTQPVTALTGCSFERFTEEMCRTKPGVVSVSRADLEYLKIEVNKTTRKRIRLCTHQSDDALLHEMFVVYTGMTYVRANCHIGKDESLHILEGYADFIFFDKDGNILEVIELGDKNSGKNVFIRVPKGVFHTIIMKSDYLIIHEATPGPFNRDDTLWAPWAPLDSDIKAVAAYQVKLAIKLAEFSLTKS